MCRRTSINFDVEYPFHIIYACVLLLLVNVYWFIFLVCAEAIVDFEESSYIFPEGSTGEVCLTITNSVTLVNSLAYSISIQGLFYIINHRCACARGVTVLVCGLLTLYTAATKLSRQIKVMAEFYSTCLAFLCRDFAKKGLFERYPGICLWLRSMFCEWHLHQQVDLTKTETGKLECTTWEWKQANKLLQSKQHTYTGSFWKGVTIN